MAGSGVKMGKTDEAGTASAVLSALSKILRPLARICIRHGVPYSAFADAAKDTFVEVASTDFRIPRRKPSASRVSVLTGIPRKEAARILSGAVQRDGGDVEAVNRIARIISGWRNDPVFLDKRGRPASLPFDGGARSFSELVRRHGGDVTPRATLDELLRSERVEYLKNGRVRLLDLAYVAPSSLLDRFGMLGTDVPEMIASIEHNLTAKPREKFFQRKVAYDNLPTEAVQALRVEIGDDSQRLLEKFDRQLSQHDRDVNAEIEGAGRGRVVVGVYYFEEEVSENDEG